MCNCVVSIPESLSLSGGINVQSFVVRKTHEIALLPNPNNVSLSIISSPFSVINSELSFQFPNSPESPTFLCERSASTIY